MQVTQIEILGILVAKLNVKEISKERLASFWTYQKYFLSPSIENGIPFKPAIWVKWKAL